MTTDAHGFCGECGAPVTDATGQPDQLNQPAGFTHQPDPRWLQSQPMEPRG